MQRITYPHCYLHKDVYILLTPFPSTLVLTEDLQLNQSKTLRLSGEWHSQDKDEVKKKIFILPKKKSEWVIDNSNDAKRKEKERLFDLSKAMVISIRDNFYSHAQALFSITKTQLDFEASSSF